ncbi:MAG: peptide chain release factor 2 [Planctomycetota bacterium]
MTIADCKAKLNAQKAKFVEIRDLFDLDQAKRRLGEIEIEMQKDGFWNNQERSAALIAEMKAFKTMLEPVSAVDRQLEDLAVMLELAEEEGEGGEAAAELEREVVKLETRLQELEFQVLLDGEYDQKNCFLSVQAGTGGTEACDWARMLARLYTRWGERHDYAVEVVERLDDDDSGGIKSVTLLISGPYAYGYLKAESGVHRLVRISPFDAQKRRHTSFCSVEAMPELDDQAEVEVNVNDLRIDTFRAGGAGGQHVNKTDSAIRITHLPTGIVVQCQNERSQHKNKSTAMKMLKAKLAALKAQEREAEIKQLQGVKSEIGFGHQIRSYVFQPYTLAKDHRTELGVGNVEAVMDGDIDQFLMAYLKSRKSK